MAIAFPITLTEGGVSIASTVSAQETLRAGLTEAASVLIAFSVTDSCAITSDEATPTFPAVISAADSCAVQASEGTPTVIDPNTASFAVTDTLQLGTTDAVTVLVSATVADTISDFIPLIVPPIMIANENITLQVFTGSSTNFVTVSDSLRVRLNGAETVTPPATVSATDSLAIGLSEASSSVPSVVASESMRVVATDAAQTPAVVITVSESLSVTVVEPQDQTASFGVLDSLTVSLTDAINSLAGSFAFNVSDSCAVQVDEAVPTFATVTVGATESLRVQLEEAFVAAVSASAFTSLAVQLSETVTLVKAIAVSDTIAIIDTETGASLFNDFQQFTAADSCAVQLSESVTELITFLTQLSTTDSCAVQISEAVTAQSVTVGVEESLAIQATEESTALNTFSVADSLAVRLTEVGIEIPIVPVNLFTFVNESEPIGFIDDVEPLTWGIFTEDTCQAIAEEGTAEYASVANATGDLWNGTTNTEHKREVARPSRYRLVGSREW